MLIGECKQPAPHLLEPGLLTTLLNLAEDGGVAYIRPASRMTQLQYVVSCSNQCGSARRVLGGRRTACMLPATALSPPVETPDHRQNAEQQQRVDTTQPESPLGSPTDPLEAAIVYAGEIARIFPPNDAAVLPRELLQHLAETSNTAGFQPQGASSSAICVVVVPLRVKESYQTASVRHGLGVEPDAGVRKADMKMLRERKAVLHRPLQTGFARIEVLGDHDSSDQAESRSRANRCRDVEDRSYLTHDGTFPISHSGAFRLFLPIVRVILPFAKPVFTVPQSEPPGGAYVTGRAAPGAVLAPPEIAFPDVLGGSGPTLIACEQTGRRAFLMEMDTLYADVIVQRWEEFTGRKGRRITHAQNLSGSTSIDQAP